MSIFFGSCLRWFRRRLAWSNSRQSWQERVGFAGLVGAAVAVAWFSDRFSRAQQVLLWGLLLVAFAVLLRRGWLKLFGPVLFYDLIRTSRRGRYFLIRGAYAGFLLLLLGWQYLAATSFSDWEGPSREMANIAESFFYTFMFVQFLAVVFLTPAYAAGAVAEEKERRTLEFVLATDLRDREIVLSKLAARMGNLMLLVLAGLPILSFTQFLGGVDPGLVLAGSAATLLTVLSLAAFSIFNSVVLKRSRDAILLTYLGIVAYIGFAFLFLALAHEFPEFAQFPSTLERPSPVTGGDVVEALNAGNLILVLYRLGAAVDANQQLSDVLPGLLRNYAIFHGLMATVWIGWAVLRLRAVALRQAYGGARRGAARLLPRPRPAVGNQPMLWKELLVEGGVRLHWLGKVLVLLFVLASFGSIFLFLDVSGWQTVEETTNIWVRAIGTIVACLGLLSVAVRAAGSITGERERQTLDGLLTTQLSIDAIFFSKWAASILSVRWTWLWLGLIAAIGVVTGGVHPLALPLLLSAWLVYAAFLAGLGMWFTAASRTAQRATLWMLGTAFALGGGHWLIWMCCSPFLLIGFGSTFFAEAIEHLAMFQLFALTPPATLVFLAFQGDDLRHIDDKTTRLIPVFIMVGIFLYSVGGLVLYGLGRERFRRMTRRRREGSLPLERRAEEPSPVLAADENAPAGATPPVHSTPEQEGSQAAG